MQKMYKEILITNVVEKQERAQQLTVQKEQSIKISLDRHLSMRDQILENFYDCKLQQRPIQMESHKQDWEINVKKAKKTKSHYD